MTDNDYAVRQIERAKEKTEASGKDFIRNEHGKILPIQENVILALQKMDVSLSYDIFSRRTIISGLSGFGPYLQDDAVIRLYLEIEKRFSFRVGKELFWMIIGDTARRNAFHPVKEYLASLMWDGKSRIGNWLISYAGAEDTKYVREVGKLVFIAAVRRILQPGCKFDEMLILESKQGTEKSTAIKTLSVRDEWFTDDLPLNASTKEQMEHIEGRWIVEAGELKGIRKGDVAALKSFLSRQSDKARKAYGRISEERLRECVIIGTTNDDKYLSDSTGNRRFWPVRVEKFNLNKLEKDRDQLWAEAVHYESKGASIRLDKSLWKDAELQQEERRTEDPYVQMLSSELDGKRGKIKADDVWRLLEIPPSYRTQDNNRRVGEVMRELGWTRDKRRFGGEQPEWCYIKGNKEETEKNVINISHDGYARPQNREHNHF